MSLITAKTILNAHFSDMEQLCSEVRNWDLRFQPLQLNSAAGEIGRVIQATTGQFDCTYARFLENIDQKGAPPPGRYTFTIPGKSLQSLWWCGKPVGPQDIMVFSPTSELHSISGQDFEVHLLSIQQNDIRHIADRCGLKFPDPGAPPSVFRAPLQLIQKCRGLLDQIRTRPDTLCEDQLDQLAEDLVVCWLSQIGIIGSRITMPNASSAMETVLDMIASGQTTRISLSRICDECGISRRALELSFKHRFNTGPAAFVKQARLADARRRLTRLSDHEATVSEIMNQTGFTHVGQFATDYRKAFGELPSQTLSR